MIALARQNLFDFEQLSARRNALFLLLIAAIVSPNVGMPSPLPAIRLEQVALAFLLPSLFLFYKHHPEMRRVSFVDWAFLAMGAAVAISLVFSPLIVSQSNYSIRDPFEVARVIEYWLLFRLAFTVASDEAGLRGTVRILLAAAVVSGIFSALQYLGKGSFNDTFTSIWADTHNFDGVVRRSRVVGFVGNPNYFGIFGGLLLVVSLALVLLRVPMTKRDRWLVPAGVTFATACIVMSQSRTVALAVLGAMGLTLCLVFLVRRRQAAYGLAIGMFLIGLAISIAFVEIFPPKFGSINDRFNLTQITSDPSVTIRITKWKSLFAGFLRDAPDRCSNIPLNARPTMQHEPRKLSSASAPADVLARDAQRKQDIADVSRAVQRYSCDADAWPTGDLAAALVPKYLPALPTDPKSGDQYQAFLQKGGFLVGADLENPADPEGPVYALGTIPNIIVNPSFDTTAHWQTATSADGRPSTTLDGTGDGLFGDSAINAEIGATSSLYQLTVFDFPLSEDYTASIWARSDAGSDQTIALYLIGTLADGQVMDPMAKVQATLPGDGRWVPLKLTFQTPPANRLTVFQLSVRALAGQPAKVTLDGAALNQGPFPASFPYVTDVNPSRLRPSDIAGFSDSPLIGIGPQKDRQVGAFDNEYALMLDRYGGIGTLAYLTLMLAAFLVPLAGMRNKQPGNLTLFQVALSVGLVTYSIAQAVFNVAAGSYYSFQIMAIYWLLIGFCARGVADARRRPVVEPATGKLAQPRASAPTEGRPLAGPEPAGAPSTATAVEHD